MPFFYFKLYLIYKKMQQGMLCSIELRAPLNLDPEHGETQENISIKSTSTDTMVMFAVCVFHTILCFVVFGSMKQNSAGFSDGR